MNLIDILPSSHLLRRQFGSLSHEGALNNQINFSVYVTCSLFLINFTDWIRRWNIIDLIIVLITLTGILIYSLSTIKATVPINPTVARSLRVLRIIRGLYKFYRAWSINLSLKCNISGFFFFLLESLNLPLPPRRGDLWELDISDLSPTPRFFLGFPNREEQKNFAVDFFPLQDPSVILAMIFLSPLMLCWIYYLSHSPLASLNVLL